MLLLDQNNIYNWTSTSISPVKIYDKSNNKNNNEQEENEDLDIISTQIDYYLDINNIQMKDDNSIIREDNDDGTNSIQGEVNSENVNNNNVTTDDDGKNDILMML